MRYILPLFFVALLAGCTTQQDARIPQLEYEVKKLEDKVSDISTRLDKTTETAVSASTKATKATSTAARAAKDVKKVDDKADAANDTAAKALAVGTVTPTITIPVEVVPYTSPIPPTGKKSVIMKPREINHETSILPE